MTKEEAIEEFNNLIKLRKNKAGEIKHDNCIVSTRQLEIALNLIQEQQKDNEKKDKIIDLMAEKFEDLKLAYLKKENGGEIMGKYRTYNKNDWKQYFENQAKM